MGRLAKLGAAVTIAVVAGSGTVPAQAAAPRTDDGVVEVATADEVAVAEEGDAAIAAAASREGPNGYFVMWQNDNYEGQEEARKRYDSNLHNDSCSGCDPGPGGNFGDDMSSFYNNTGFWWVIRVDRHDATTVNNDVWCVRPRTHDGDLGNNGFTNLEDEISSVERLSRDGHHIERCGDPSHEIGHK